MNKELHLIGLNYKTAPLEVREAFALSDKERYSTGLIPLNGEITEYMVISTCNRVEILVVGNGQQVDDIICTCWTEAVGKRKEDLLPYIYRHKGNDAIRHLLTVTSSLDSMVLGEPQILGQIKEAYRFAVEQGTAKVILSRLLHKAFSVAKRVRTETAVASSAVSISYAAIELAKRIFDDMHKVRAMLIGAGEMAELAAAYLVNAGIQSITVANRTPARAEELALRFNGKSISMEELQENLAEVDIVISSTSSQAPVIYAKEMKAVMRKRKNNPMFFIDIAVPRDIAPEVNNIDNIYLYDIDDLKEVVEENLAHRKEEAKKAHSIVQEETLQFRQWVESLNLQPTIVDFLRRNEQIAQTELEKTLKNMGGALTEQQRMALEVMLASLVKKLSHDPLCFLKHGMDGGKPSAQHLSLFRRIFNLDKQ